MRLHRALTTRRLKAQRVHSPARQEIGIEAPKGRCGPCGVSRGDNRPSLAIPAGPIRAAPANQLLNRAQLEDGIDPVRERVPDICPGFRLCGWLPALFCRYGAESDITQWSSEATNGPKGHEFHRNAQRYEQNHRSRQRNCWHPPAIPNTALPANFLVH